MRCFARSPGSGPGMTFEVTPVGAAWFGGIGLDLGAHRPGRADHAAWLSGIAEIVGADAGVYGTRGAGGKERERQRASQ
ncbi:hypothetical protein LMG27177_01682 [Paraburkholderia fynbosensis]|uniref:Uncharacterized protein n=1 Tax=Paraburkholderia fynbosensis TaxID=1200993 RepID=A0A6J5FUZ7_9BURK|nr:hypothetical protein LMG27177_01682 [Paraburkholderia fynbosensis]